MPPPSDGGSILPPTYAPLREVIGDYEIVAKIGQGGMGAVYRARQVSLDRQVALKLLPAQMVGDEEAVARFQREARVASSLRHPNLVAVYAAGEVDGCHFIAMELIEGEDLGCRLKRGDPLTAPEALRVCAEVVRALEHGWRSAQLIHRDIKPSNIFLSDDGAVKLGDLGLAKTLLGNSTGLTQTGAMMGTAHYMSPEQARGDRELDFRADIYSLGCTLYQMLTGQLPYRGSDAITIIRQHLDAPLPAILKVWPQCPVPLARLVGRMLKKSRHERPASYAELLGQIDSVWAQIDPVGHSPEAFAPPPRQAEPEMTAPLIATPPAAPPAPRSKGLLYGGFAAGVLVLAAVAFLVWPKKEPLTKAEIMAAQRAAEASARAHDPARAAQTSEDGGDGKAGGDKAAPSAADKLPVPKAAAPESAADTHPQPRVWIDDTEKIRSGLKDGSVVADGEWLVATKNFFTNLGGERSSHDSAVRVVFSNRIMVILRQSAKQYVAEGGKHVSIYLYDPATHKTMGLGEVEMGTAYVPDATHELVFAAQGDQLSLWLDGREVAHVSDATLTAGKMALGLMTGAEPAPRIKKVEYGELEPAGTGQAPATPGPARLSPSAEPWQDVLRDPAKLILSGGAARTPEGLRFPGSGFARLVPGQGPQRDGAVRMRATVGDSRLQLRARANAAGVYLLAAGSDQKTVWLGRFDNVTKKTTALREFPVSVPFQQGQDYELELRVVGQSITAKCNGEALGSVTDGTYPEGELGVGLPNHNDTPALLKALEVLNLDAPAAATADSPTEVLTFAGQRYQFVRESLTWTGAKARAEAMRGHLATVTSKDEDAALEALLQSQLTTQDHFIVHIGGYRQNQVWRWITGEPFDYTHWQPGEPNDNAQTQTYLEYWNNRTRQFAWSDNASPIMNHVRGFIVEWDDAPDATKDATTLSETTKERPFLNSLGMKFVPVPITGGPSGGQRVLFSVWETRVQDYEVFANETKRAWPKPKFPQGPTHAAVNVNRADAQAFSVWLTERERKAGRLGTQESYRLPTDHEWSCAAGIGTREDASQLPMEKSGKLPGVFPWGDTWPPPAGTGNFSGEEAVGHEVWAGQKPLVGYRDAFPETSPVGSFPANPLGLFDLAGNVWEFCDDAQGNTSRRGCSFGISGPLLNSSTRVAMRDPALLEDSNGFRVVLAPIK